MDAFPSGAGCSGHKETQDDIICLQPTEWQNTVRKVY